MTAASNSAAREPAAGIAASNPTAPEVAGTLEGAPGADSEALATQGLLLRLLVGEYGDEEWAELGSLRRIARSVDGHFDVVIREHVAAALDEIEQRIDGWREMAEWAAAHTEDADQAQNAAIRGRAYSRAARIVRGYRQEQDR